MTKDDEEQNFVNPLPIPASRRWVKLWVESWFSGTMRFTLTREERAVWVDLLALAGMSRIPGVICAGEEGGKLIGYPLSWLARMVDVHDTLTLLELLEKFVQQKRISVQKEEPKGDDRVIISLLNWAKYQTDYSKQARYKAKKRKEKQEGDRKGYPRLPQRVTDRVTSRVTPRVTGRDTVEVEVEVEVEEEKRRKNQNSEEPFPNPGILTNQRHNHTIEHRAKKTAAMLESDLAAFFKQHPAFVDFWERYPRKIGKRMAAKNWLRRMEAGVEPQAILDGLAVWLRYWGARYWEGGEQDSQFIPHPTTFLTQHRWEETPSEQEIQKAGESHERESPAQRRNRANSELLDRFFGGEGPETVRGDVQPGAERAAAGGLPDRPGGPQAPGARKPGVREGHEDSKIPPERGGNKGGL